MDFKEIDEFLKSNIDTGYKEFNENLLPGMNNIQGIRIPILRKLSKEIYIKSDYKKFINSYDEMYFEEIMLKGFVIGQMNTKNDDLEEIIEYIENFIPKINNWSVCDSFCNSLKITKKYREEILTLLESYSYKQGEYELRFVMVMLISHYVEEGYLDRILAIINRVDYSKEVYYIDMAVAWLLTEVYTKYPGCLIDNINNFNISDSIKMKFIRKVKDSYKISDENTKELVYHINKG